MKKFLCGFLFSCSAFAAVTYTSQINLSPVSAIVEQKVGASLVVTTTGGSSLTGASIVSVKPQVWVTNTGSSTTSFAFGQPFLQRNAFVYGNTLWGGSLTIQPMSFIFHAPSIYPAYGSSIQVGTQTYSVSAQVQMSDGTIFYPTAGTITVGPRPLPSSQVSGWH